MNNIVHKQGLCNLLNNGTRAIPSLFCMKSSAVKFLEAIGHSSYLSPRCNKRRFYQVVFVHLRYMILWGPHHVHLK